MVWFKKISNVDVKCLLGQQENAILEQLIMYVE